MTAMESRFLKSYCLGCRVVSAEFHRSFSVLRMVRDHCCTGEKPSRITAPSGQSEPGDGQTGIPGSAVGLCSRAPARGLRPRRGRRLHPPLRLHLQ